VLSFLLLLSPAEAQTFTTLHTFAASSTNLSGALTNAEGAFPKGGLTLCGKCLYGTTSSEGLLGGGTVFSINIDGTGYLPIHSFPDVPPNPGPYTNSEGAGPGGRLVISGDAIYGPAETGGVGMFGTLFKVETNGRSLALVHTFSSDIPIVIQDGFFVIPTNSDGAFPNVLIPSETKLYGTATYGGSSDGGTVFSLNTDGTAFTVLHNFTGLTTNLSGAYTNADGAAASPALVLSGTNLYGAANGGGTFGNGTVFRLNTDGTGFQVLHHFSATGRWYEAPNTNSDGGFPMSLLLAGTTLYGSTSLGGDSGNGTIFKLNTDGTGFTTLHSFSAYGWNFDMTHATNSDGFSPHGGLALSSNGGTLYGAAYYGGTSGYGTIFSLKTDGTGFKTLHNFIAGAANSSGAFINHDGGNPLGDLAVVGNTLYGTANIGGGFGNGTVFSISLAPPLKINHTITNLVLSWPTNFPGFTLQSSDTLASPTWLTASPPPVVLNNQNTVVLPIPSGRQFYRLSR